MRGSHSVPRGCGIITGLLASVLLAGGIASAQSGACGCGDGACDLMGAGGGLGPLWVEADYLLWRLDGVWLPPLVTTSPATTSIPPAGQLDDPAMITHSGNGVVNDNWRSGYRISAGLWLDACCSLAITGDYFNVGQDDYSFFGSPDPAQIMTRPFWNSETEMWDAELVSVPDELDGTVRVAAESNLQGAGAGLQACLWRSACGCGTACNTQVAQLMLVGGYRYYQHDSLVGISEDLTVLPNTTTPLVPGTHILVNDRFAARNEFHGGELGVRGQVARGKLRSRRTGPNCGGRQPPYRLYRRQHHEHGSRRGDVSV